MRGTCLEVLDVSNNEIGQVGCEHIARTLSTNQMLRVLQMGHNCIGDAALVLGSALASNDTLVYLDVQHCQIGSATKDLVAAIGGNTSLIELNLSGNRIDEAAAEVRTQRDPHLRGSVLTVAQAANQPLKCRAHHSPPSLPCRC